MEAVRVFNYDKSDQNREYLCLRKKAYKNLIRTKRKLFEVKKTVEIQNLRHCRPKQFWKYFKKKRKHTGEDISADDFHKYVSKLADDMVQGANEDAEQFCKQNDFNNLDCSFEELNKVIEISEVKAAVESLKRDKAIGNDCLMNEYFIECIDILAAHLCDIFNNIFDSGYFPESWTEGIIIPVHKKGDTSNVNNYRGITLVSCLSNLFTTIIEYKDHKCLQ
jgi:hypothetical protein